MDRNNIEKIAQNQEDKLLLAKIYDKINAGMRKNVPANTPFLSQREQELAQYLCGSAEGLVFCGGYDCAQRKMLIYLPDYMDTDAISVDFCPFVCLRATYYENDSLTHRDFLGALIGCGIARECIGDICVSKGSCDFLVSAEIAPYILQNFTSAGRTKLKVKEIVVQDMLIPQEQTVEIRDTVASLRLDCIASAGFKVGRKQVSDAIAIGRAAIDGLPCEKPEKQLSEGTIITIRGMGKIRLTHIHGETKKGRISVVIDHYV